MHFRSRNGGVRAPRAKERKSVVSQRQSGVNFEIDAAIADFEFTSPQRPIHELRLLRSRRRPEWDVHRRRFQALQAGAYAPLKQTTSHAFRNLQCLTPRPRRGRVRIPHRLHFLFVQRSGNHRVRKKPELVFIKMSNCRPFKCTKELLDRLWVPPERLPNRVTNSKP
jgi:hypothetical protein